AAGRVRRDGGPRGRRPAAVDRAHHRRRGQRPADRRAAAGGARPGGDRRGPGDGGVVAERGLRPGPAGPADRRRERRTLPGHGGRPGRGPPGRGRAHRNGGRLMVRRLAALLALLMVAACTGGGDGGGPGAVGSADEVPGTSVVGSGRDVAGEDGIRQQLIDAWNSERRRSGSEYRARLVELPGSADEQRSQLLGALQSGSAAYDVVNLDVTWVPEFAAAGLVRPLPGNLVDEDVVPSVAGTARWDGEVYRS